MGRLVYDIMVDEDMDDIHRDGDFLVDECTQQNQKLLLITEKAGIKHEPKAGIGVLSWILDEVDAQDLKAEVQSQYEADGLRISSMPAISLENFSITASYE